MAALAVVQDQNRTIADSLIIETDELTGKLGSTADAARLLDSAFQYESVGAISGVTKEVDGLGEAMNRVLQADPFTQFEDFMNGTFTGVSAASQMTDQFKELDATLTGMATSGNAAKAAEAFAQITQVAEEQGIGVEKLAALFPQYSEALRAAGGASTAASSDTEVLAGTLDETARSALAADEAQKALVESINAQASAALAASGSMIGYYEAVDAATAAAEKNTGGLNKNKDGFDRASEAGRAQEKALLGVASAALSAADGMRENGDSTQKVAGYTEQARADFIKVARQMGLTKDAAGQLADEYGLIPAEVVTDVSTPGAKDSISRVTEFNRRLQELPESEQTSIKSIFERQGIDAAERALNRVSGRTVNTYIRTIQLSPRAVAGGGKVGDAPIKLAGGGYFGGKVSGPGTWTSDDVGPVYLSRDEFVIRAASATAIDRKRPGFLDALNAQGANTPGLATGGSLPGGFTFAPASAVAPAPATVASQNVTHVTLGQITVDGTGGIREALSQLTERLELDLVRMGVT